MKSSRSLFRNEKISMKDLKNYFILFKIIMLSLNIEKNLFKRDNSIYFKKIFKSKIDIDINYIDKDYL